MWQSSDGDMGADKLLLASVLLKDVESYLHGVICRAFGRMFLIAADEEVVIDNALHYLFPTDCQSVGPQWTITYDSVPLTYFVQACEYASGGEYSEVKPGFSYEFRSVGKLALFRAAKGFERDPHLIIVHHTRVSIVAPESTEVLTRLPIRLLREIGLRLSQNEGACFMHVSCVDRINGGILVVGGSGSGKTTTLMHLMRCEDARFVCNDRAVGRIEGGAVRIDAWPLGVRVGRGTHDSFGELTGPIGALRRSENQLAHGALAERKALDWGSRVKFELTPLELCHRFQRGATMTSLIRHIVYPALSLDDSPLTLVRCEDGSHAICLDAEITEPFDREYGRGWMRLRTISDEVALSNKQALIVASLELSSWRLVGDPRRVPEAFYQELNNKLV